MALNDKTGVPSAKVLQAIYAALDEKGKIEKDYAHDVTRKRVELKKWVVKHAAIQGDLATFIKFLNQTPKGYDLEGISRATRSIGQSEIYSGRVGRGRGSGRS